MLFWYSLVVVNALLVFSFSMYFCVRLMGFDGHNLVATRKPVMILTLTNVFLLAGDVLRRMARPEGFGLPYGELPPPGVILVLLCTLMAVFFSGLTICLIQFVGVDVALRAIKRGDVFALPVSCGEFAETLLKEAGLSFQVKSAFIEAGACQHDKKQIILSYPLESHSVLALLQAGHEVGHAARGLQFFARHKILTIVLHVFMLVSALVSGLAKMPAWPSLIITFVIAAAFFYIALWRNEIKATEYGIEKLLNFCLKKEERQLVKKRMRYEVIVIVSQTLAWMALYTSAAWFFYEFGRYVKDWWF